MSPIVSPISPNGKIKEQCHSEWGTRLGWGRRLEITTLLSPPQIPHPIPKLKLSTAALGHSQAGVPSLLLRSAMLSRGPRAPRFIVLAPQPAGSPRPGELAAPWKWGVAGPLPLTPLHGVTTGPFPPSSPSCQPIAKAEPGGLREARAGCCPNAGER